MTVEFSQNENNLQYLDSDWKLATVYTAFLVPKSHQDAVRLIYNLEYDKNKRAPIIQHPQKWVKDARVLLMERNLITITEQKLKSTILKANVDPIIQSLIEMNRNTMKDLSVLEGVRLVLDSQWFRNFFTFENLHHPMTYKDGSVYEPYRNLEKIIGEEKTKKLEVRNLQNRIFQLLYEIGYYSQNIRFLSKRLIHNDLDITEDPIFEDLLNVKNYDAFLRNHMHEVPPCFIQTILVCMQSMGIEPPEKIYSDRLMDKIVNEYSGIFMPTQIAIALRQSLCTRSVNTIDFGYVRKLFMSSYRAHLKQYEESMKNAMTLSK